MSRKFASAGERRAYMSWRMMKYRCDTPSCVDYAYYGGRGITYDSRWKTFAVFFADMGERPAGLTLERKDNTAGYSAENCKWATYVEQNNNASFNVLLTHNGQTKSLSTWAAERGLKRQTVFSRYYKHGLVPELLLKPARGYLCSRSL